MKILSLLFLAIFVLLSPVQASAQLQAHFRAHELDYDGNDDDCDFTVSGLPTCELYFRMGVFVGNEQQGDLLNHPGGCSYFEKSDGLWNFADQTVSRNLPDMSNGAQLFFILFDHDPVDEHDLLGAHFSFSNNSGSTTEANNDGYPTGYTIKSCGNDAIDDHSNAGRFSFNYSVRFTDASAPFPPTSPPLHSDEDGGGGYDNDTTLDFQWSPASDPHSGVSLYAYELRIDDVVRQTDTLDSQALVFGAAVEGSKYELRVRARNGDVLDLDGPQWSSWTAWSAPVLVDSTQDAIPSISVLTEIGGDPISEGVAQPDDTPYFEWGVPDSTSPIAGYNTSVTTSGDCVINTVNTWATPGPLPNGPTDFYVRAIDEAGNCGPPASFTILISLPDGIFNDGFEAPPGFCNIDDDCADGEHCRENSCSTDVSQGSACSLPNECGDGLQCKDGVCCTSACDGGCFACNLTGQEGQCTAIPAGTDPDGECSGFSCSAYFFGWIEKSCYRHADVSDGGATCTGNGVCDTPSSSCLFSGQGSVAMTCGDKEVPDPSTCTGTAPPACLDAPAIITGITWNDLNSNGRVDQGENGIAAVNVEIFEDSDFDGLPDGSTLVSTLTDNSGAYAIEVPSGSYVLRVNDSGFCHSTGDDSSIDPSTDYSYSMSVSPGETVSDVNIGLAPDCLDE